MSIIELFLIAVGLSMDAFAVSVCKGLAMKRFDFVKAAKVGLYFGIFQAVMPLIGYLLGAQFADQIEAFDHWIAFFLLAVIGGKMVYESIFNSESGDAEPEEGCTAPKKMFPLALATSIDALAVGISFAFLRVQIVPAVSFIGVVTLVISVIGVKFGNLCGNRYQAKAELIGGLILVLIGAKILLEHLGILGM